VRVPFTRSQFTSASSGLHFLYYGTTVISSRNNPSLFRRSLPLPSQLRCGAAR
jgi:hypothetical protein